MLHPDHPLTVRFVSFHPIRTSLAPTADTKYQLTMFRLINLLHTYMSTTTQSDTVIPCLDLFRMIGDVLTQVHEPSTRLILLSQHGVE